MAEINIFRVQPFGKGFATSDMSLTIGDTNHAFYQAHLAAAKQAANLMIPSWVMRDDLDYRMGFGPGAEDSPNSDLYKILQLGLGSYWDRSTTSWMPVPKVKRLAEDQVEKLLEA